MPIYTPGRRRTMLILLLTSIMLITIDLRGNALLDAGRSGFDYAFRPFEIAAEVVTRPIVRAWAGVTEVDDLQDENQELRDELDATRGDLVAAENALIQNQQMRQLLELQSLAEYDRVTCGTIGASPSNDVQTVEIDCGTLDGLRTGMPVVNAAGLVGKITRAAPETAIVMLLTDPSYAIAVKVVGEEAPVVTAPPTTTPSGLPVDSIDDIAEALNTTTTSTTTTTVPGRTSTTTTPPDTSVPPSSLPGEIGTGGPPGLNTTTTESTTTTTLVRVTRETGMLNGVGGDQLPRVRLINDSPQFTSPSVGDVVLTTGGERDLAPPDLPIGRVANIIRRPGTEGLELEIEPNADLTRLDFLTVVLYQPATEMPG